MSGGAIELSLTILPIQIQMRDTEFLYNKLCYYLQSLVLWWMGNKFIVSKGRTPYNFAHREITY